MNNNNKCVTNDKYKKRKLFKCLFPFICQSLQKIIYSFLVMKVKMMTNRKILALKQNRNNFFLIKQKKSRTVYEFCL
jgi:hypothetical protein